MEQEIDILQVAKCFAAEERIKTEQAKKALEEHNEKYVRDYNNIKDLLLNAVTKLHDNHTPHGLIDVLVSVADQDFEDKDESICLISIGDKKFCRLDVFFRYDHYKKDQYAGVVYAANFWDVDSNCNDGWFGLKHTDSCKSSDIRYSGTENIPHMLQTIGYKLSKFLV